jgi:hypothetical protein
MKNAKGGKLITSLAQNMRYSFEKEVFHHFMPLAPAAEWRCKIQSRSIGTFSSAVMVGTPNRAL